jgi:hypothetical protein
MFAIIINLVLYKCANKLKRIKKIKKRFGKYDYYKSNLKEVGSKANGILFRDETTIFFFVRTLLFV